MYPTAWSDADGDAYQNWNVARWNRERRETPKFSSAPRVRLCIRLASPKIPAGSSGPDPCLMNLLYYLLRRQFSHDDTPLRIDKPPGQVNLHAFEQAVL